MKLTPGHPYPLGATYDGEGVNFAIFAENATSVELCLFKNAKAKSEYKKIVLWERSHQVWHVYIPGLKHGQLYGYRVHGNYDPLNGQRYNPNKLLIDPYAKAISGKIEWDDSLFGYDITSPEKDLSFSKSDSAAFLPKSVVIDPAFDWEGIESPEVPYENTIIYELHVKGFSELNPLIPEKLRGTYAGLAHPESIKYLKFLGITSVELMPVHHFVADRHLKERGLTNYWGYNTIGFFAPETRYSSSGCLGEQVTEFKEMVKALHAAGIEVILDVVYNHTAEGNELGPTLSFKGIDNAAYYRLAEDKRYYMDYTGTGNTLNANLPSALRLIMDSLRYWITEMHVDGLRFDLAATLARELHAVDQLSAFFDIIHQDPVISQVKLIAEPWDVGEADYEAALQIRIAVLKQAYDTFLRGSFPELMNGYEAFVNTEAFWLRDFALFEVLRDQNKEAPWHQWPVPLRDRHPEALESFSAQFEHAINWVMWTQYIFHRQWKFLQKYCHDREIRLMGDLPFYLDHDSVDVWARRDLFAVNADGSLLAVAGVPPDYFSADGQLWGMPVYNWEAMRLDNYTWFIGRIQRNLACFNILRLDHFRAFAAYWEVEASQATARNGSWKQGPQQELFNALIQAVGNCDKFVAEDLGDITPDVYALRDSLQLPGMHVLQFAFGDNVASTVHSPHNHRERSIVYTGTHDNNTTKGWYRKELDAASRTRLAKYVGKRITPMNVCRALINMAYGSVAQTAMIPMQDLLNLSERSRLNTPATVNPINWRWRLSEIPDLEEAERMCELTRLFGR